MIPNHTFFEVSSTEPKALSNGYRAITTALKLQDWEQRPLDSSIQMFCRYVTTAQDHESDGQIEESLLHLVFALDLLLGGKAGESLTVVLAERVSILSHLALKREFGDIVAFIKECYDLRSGYVHRGAKGNVDGLTKRLDELMPVVRAVIGAACFARRKQWAQSDDARTAWINRIDVLRAKRAAGIEFEAAEISGLGLSCIHVDSGELVGVSVEFGE